MRRSRRLASLGLCVALALTPLAGCGDGSGEADAPRATGGGQVDTPTGTGGARTPLPPGPSIGPGAAIAADELVIEDDDLDAVRTAVRQQGGRVTQVLDEGGVTAARFVVDDRDHLLRIRDALRAAGFDAAVSPVIGDPGGASDDFPGA